MNPEPATDRTRVPRIVAVCLIALTLLAVVLVWPLSNLGGPDSIWAPLLTLVPGLLGIAALLISLFCLVAGTGVPRPARVWAAFVCMVLALACSGVGLFLTFSRLRDPLLATNMLLPPQFDPKHPERYIEEYNRSYTASDAGARRQHQGTLLTQTGYTGVACALLMLRPGRRKPTPRTAQPQTA